MSSTSTSLANLTARKFHEHQYVKVSLSPTKSEIGIVVETRDVDGTAVVATRHGYDITVNQTQLQRAYLLVLDLNGVLGARQKKTVFEKRPHIDQFIKFALTNFVVSVWTSCEERNGRQILEDLFGDDRDRLLFTMFRGDCTPSPTPDRPYATKKNLQVIFDKYPESFHAVNTVIVDDSPDKCSHPDIALCPPTFLSLTEQPDDDGLLKTIATLEEILKSDSLDPLITAAAERLRIQALEDDARARANAAKISDVAAQVMSTASMHALEEKMILCCRHSLSANCRFGTSCKFSHADNGSMACNYGEKCKVHHSRAEMALRHQKRTEDLLLGLHLAGSARPHVAPPPQAFDSAERSSPQKFDASLLAKLCAASLGLAGHCDTTHSAETTSLLGSFVVTESNATPRRQGSSGPTTPYSDTPSKHRSFPNAVMPPVPHRTHQMHQPRPHSGGGVKNSSGGGARSVTTIFQNAHRAPLPN